MQEKDLMPGLIVRHKKGGRYTVVGVAKNTETLESLVIYSPIWNPNILYARPLQMFLDPGRFIEEDKA